MITARHIVIKKSNYTQLYRSSEPMQSDFNLLYLLFNDEKVDSHYWSKFAKNSSLTCWTTSKIFINKHGRNIELFDVLDLISNDNLALPKSPKFTMTIHNFMQFMAQLHTIQEQQPQNFYIAIDEYNFAHATTDLASIKKKTLFTLITSKVKAILKMK